MPVDLTRDAHYVNRLPTLIEPRLNSVVNCDRVENEDARSFNMF